MQAELFAELGAAAGETGFVPFTTEVPYVTRFPVTLPKGSGGTSGGSSAVKWIVLCFYSEQFNRWCWVELKVRSAEQRDRQEKATKEALDAVNRDTVALMGLDIPATAETWRSPD